MTELHLDRGGLWAIRSTSPSVIYLDLDRRRLLRVRRATSPAWAYDGRWLRLVAVESIDGRTGVVTVGDRHLYLTDPDGGLSPFQWWAPRMCTSIQPVTADEMPHLGQRES